MAKTLKRMTLASDRDEVPRVTAFVDDINQQVQFDKERYNQVLLALSEAVTNAIVHGNKEDPSKTVSVIAWTDDGSLNIRVEDEGEGFDPDSLPDPLKDQNLLKEGGRGVFLMRQYTDNIQFSDQGSTVTLQFILPNK